MPGIYGSTPFLIGKPSKQKPVVSGLCAKCSTPAYRQTYDTATKAWRWEHEACAPKTRYERRTTRDGAAIGYVPANYERSTSFDPAMAAAIKRSQGRD